MHFGALFSFLLVVPNSSPGKGYKESELGRIVIRRALPLHPSSTHYLSPPHHPLTMVALTPRFASLLAFVASSSLLMSGIEALPFRDVSTMYAFIMRLQADFM